ncbi:MAG TPA: hypothetical protein GXX29_07025 [Firmicutes bacterium]|nr:hypothetical protein [Bacillota bacterium]
MRIRYWFTIILACAILLMAAPLAGQPALAAAAEETGEETAAETTGEAAEEKTTTSSTPTDPTAALTQVPEEIKEGEGVPVREKQFVYGLSPWSGTEYSGTFAPRQAKTIYLMGNVTNIVNSLRSEIYYWPITQEYMADWFGYKEDVPGRLEVFKEGSNEPTVFEKTPYCYSYPNGWDAGVVLVTGEAAYAEFDKFNAAYDAFYDASSKYYDEHARWQKILDGMLQRVRETGQYYKEEEIPKPPVQPTAPKIYVTEPVNAFLVKLEPGNYRIRVVGEDGNVVPDSEKKLVVFDARRTGVGYEIIPESTWTRPFNSDDRTQVLYAEGRRTFYTKPYMESEYNLFNYSRMISLHKPLEGLGTKSAWLWIHEKEITDAKLELLKDGEVIEVIERKPFYVEQTAGYGLGYRIVDFDPEKPEFQGREPSFVAYKVVVEPKAGEYMIRLVDENGEVIPGSERELRAVGTTRWPLYTIPVLPLLVGLGIFMWRRSLAGSGEEEA